MKLNLTSVAQRALFDAGLKNLVTDADGKVRAAYVLAADAHGEAQRLGHIYQNVHAFKAISLVEEGETVG